jgi:SAM-dependent methyltransferase
MAEIEYGARYFEHHCGVPYERSEHWLEFFGEIAEGIVRDFQPATVLDAGCAMGFLVEALVERGIEAWGVDVSEYAIGRVHESVSDRCEVATLVEPLPRSYDLIVCIEVLEHLPAAGAEKAIANLCAATDRIVLSSSPHDYREPSHLNVQPPEAWSAMLAREGFLRDVDRELPYLPPWAAAYVRLAEPLEQTVRRYDRAWWRLRHEATELRAALLSAEQRLEKLEEGAPQEGSRLRRELDERAREALRLRDILIGKDAELGAAKGRLAELEDRQQRLLNAARRIVRLPGLVRLGSAALLRLGGRRRPPHG